MGTAPHVAPTITEAVVEAVVVVVVRLYNRTWSSLNPVAGWAVAAAPHRAASSHPRASRASTGGRGITLPSHRVEAVEVLVVAVVELLQLILVVEVAVGQVSSSHRAILAHNNSLYKIILAHNSNSNKTILAHNSSPMHAMFHLSNNSNNKSHPRAMQ